MFETKPQLALKLIARALDNNLPGEIVLADAAYGESFEFRAAIRAFGLDYAVAVRGHTKVWLLDSKERRRLAPLTVASVGPFLGPTAFRRYTWRQGTHETVKRGKLSGRFCFRRVKVAHDDGTEVADREPLWLVMEWPEGEAKATKYVLTTLPRRLSKKNIVRTLKERWRTERAYEEMKSELGLDHFEGRSWRGWHHHVSVVLCCYAFVVAERLRRFSPSARRPGQSGPLTRAA